MTIPYLDDIRLSKHVQENIEKIVQIAPLRDAVLVDPDRSKFLELSEAYQNMGLHFSADHFKRCAGEKVAYRSGVMQALYSRDTDKKHEYYLRTVEILKQRGHITQMDIRRELGVTKHTMLYIVQNLYRENLITPGKCNRGYDYRGNQGELI